MTGADAERDRGVLARKSLQGARKHIGADGRRSPDLDAAARSAHQVAHGRGALVEALERPLGVGQERAARCGQANASRQPYQQLRTEFGLQSLQARGQPRLCHVQLARGRREVARARDCEKALEACDACHS